MRLKLKGCLAAKPASQLWAQLFLQARFFQPVADGKNGRIQVFELDGFLPYRLSRLTNTVSEGIARRYRQRYDIGVPEWRVIAVLGSFPGLAASEVAERTAMDKVTVSRAVHRLRDSGLLERRPDADDRRRQRLQLTRSRGREVL